MSNLIHVDANIDNARRRQKRTAAVLQQDPNQTSILDLLSENLSNSNEESQHEPIAKIAKTQSTATNTTLRVPFNDLSNKNSKALRLAEEKLLAKLKQSNPLVPDTLPTVTTNAISKSKTKSQTTDNETPAEIRPYTDEEALAAIKKWEQETQQRLNKNDEDGDFAMITNNGHTVSSEYSDSIFEHLKASERDVAASFDLNFMDEIQGDLSYTMRAVLIDWLVEVCEEFSLQPQTFFLGIAYIDRFLSLVPIDRSQLQLLGVTALLASSKFWEIYPPSVEDYVYIADNTYDRQDILRMENSLLLSLQFRLAMPTPYDFLQQLLFRLKQAQKAKKEPLPPTQNSSTTLIYEDAVNEDDDDEDDKVISKIDDTRSNFATFIVEFFIQDATYVTFLPSIVAAAAVFYMLYTFDKSPCWPKVLRKITGYEEQDLQSCVTAIYTAHRRIIDDPALCKAVKEKYADVGKVAKFDDHDENTSMPAREN